MTRPALLLLSLLTTTASAGDVRWLEVARATERPEVRDLALALAETEVDPEVELAAARLIRSLDGDVPPALAQADALTAELRVERARQAWVAGELERAVRLLSPVREDPLAAALYAEAVDAWVGAERERLGTRYFAAKTADRRTRRAELEAVRKGLAELLGSYPDCAYADALATNLERVERELEMWL
ncbi:MAG: hypothetical protein EP330_02665 [Deltaproteobacteria bacterium]|nr:MAG: hypothetical protein EP330_02665 [Deltaproteobacteria bacterium]